MSDKTKHIPRAFISLLPKYPLISGSTVALPNYYPKLLTKTGIFQIPKDRFKLIGTTITYPEFPNKTKVLIGVSYDDKNDSYPNEYFFLLDSEKNTITQYQGKNWENNIDNRYKGAHIGNKDYLRNYNYDHATKD